ncbi:hypothetical protein [Kitasatospora sp. CB01950]|uniref:hypothetical protein n=1 Tax=Kitasatospora sp. CB01950 TaxID=1703930 RepID=UPI00116137EA|nr:hypothetical protein [Kitasatospora sp. CB01950]
MTERKLWMHEARRCGLAALALPLAAAIGVLAVSVAVGGGDHADARSTGIGMVRLLANVFPVAAGLAAATAAARDRLIEVLLALPTQYPTVVRRRITMVTALVIASATVVIVWLALAGQWANPAWGPVALLVPMGPAFFLIGAALFAQAVLRSTSAASTVVIAAWLFQVMLFDTYVTAWLANKLLLTALGAVLAYLGTRRLSDSERQLARIAPGAAQ